MCGETGVGIRGRTFFLLRVGSEVFLKFYNLSRPVNLVPCAPELELNRHKLIPSLKDGISTLRLTVKPKVKRPARQCSLKHRCSRNVASIAETIAPALTAIQNPSAPLIFPELSAPINS